MIKVPFYVLPIILKSVLVAASLTLYLGKANATVYYISSEGDDANSGTSEVQAWRSLAKLNSVINDLQPGDAVLFRRGDVFHGELRAERLGASSDATPIKFGAYGSGGKPVLTGAIPLNDWLLVSENIYKAQCDACGAELNSLFKGGVHLPKGRYPNLDDEDKGYLNIDAYTSNQRITSSSLAGDWTGATAVVKENRWTLTRTKITATSGTTISTSENTSGPYKLNYGFFVNDHINTLDQEGEWYYDPSSKEIFLYSTSKPEDNMVEAPVVDTVVHMVSCKNIHVADLSFQKANIILVKMDIIENARFDNNELLLSAGIAMDFRTCANGEFTNNLLADSNSSALMFINNTHGKAEGNTFKRIGLIAGMGIDKGYNGITPRGKQYTITRNTMDSLGWTGINFDGDDVVISENIIGHACMTIDDAGAINTWSPALSDEKNRLVKKNFVYNTVGAPEGSDRPDEVWANSIYVDDRSNNVTVDSNIVIHGNGGGILVHNAPNCTVTNNFVYNCTEYQIKLVHDRLAPESPIRNLKLTGNVMVSNGEGQAGLLVQSRRDDIDSLGVIDDNYYINPMNPALAIDERYAVEFPNPRRVSHFQSLGTWRAHRGYGKNSHSSPIVYHEGVTTVETLADESSFTSIDEAPWKFWSPGGIHDAAIVNKEGYDTEVVRGNFTEKDGDNYITMSRSFGKGVEKGQWYRLKYRASCSSEHGRLDFYIRTDQNPVEFVTRLSSGGELGQEPKEFVQYVKATASIPDARLVLELRESLDTLWIDDLSIERVELPLSSDMTFHGNADFSPKNITAASAMLLGRKGGFVEGGGEVNLEPLSGLVAFKNYENNLSGSSGFLRLQLLNDTEHPGELSGAGFYTTDTEVRIVAIPTGDTDFVHWLDGGNEVFSTDSAHTFTLRNNIMLTANFEQKSDSVVLSTQPAFQDVLQAYPNPTSGNLYLETGIEGEVYFELFDIHGRSVLKSTEPMQSDSMLDLSRLQAGVYVLRVNAQKGKGQLVVIKE